MTVVDGSERSLRQLHPNDRREVEAFQRFLVAVGPAPDLSDSTAPYRQPPAPAGWIPYVLGRFFYGGNRLLAPPIGYDEVPVTAWTFPG